MNRSKTYTVGRREDGVATVEFALVSMILFPLLFGMIQYGLMFNDFLQVRQGVRQGARTGAVASIPPASPCTGTSTTADLIKCYTRAQITPVTGTIAVRIATPSGWTKGNPLVVCAAVKSSGAVGLMPTPNGGFVTARTQMSIEQDTPAATGTFPASDTDPTGQSWSWCT